LKGIFPARYYPLRRIFVLVLAAIERELLGPRAMHVEIIIAIYFQGTNGSPF